MPMHNGPNGTGTRGMQRSVVRSNVALARAMEAGGGLYEGGISQENVLAHVWKAAWMALI